jgi:hypothetical protein
MVAENLLQLDTRYWLSTENVLLLANQRKPVVPIGYVASSLHEESLAGREAGVGRLPQVSPVPRRCTLIKILRIK